MKKKLFWKYYTRIALIVMMSFATLSITLLVFLFRYNSGQKQKQLLSASEQIVNMTSAMYSGANRGLERAFQENLRFYAINTTSNICITDKNGQIIISACTDKAVDLTKSLTKEQFVQICEVEHYKETGRLNGMFSQSSYIVAIPYVVGNEYGGIIILASPISGVMDLVVEVIKMFLYSTFLALLLTYFVTYFMIGRMMKPINDMNAAAASFGRGNFEERIEITGNDEISQLSASFNQMAHSLQELENMRSSFIASVSHELKTPMTTISGFVEGILDGTIEKDKQEYYLRIVRNEIKRLSRLVNSLLDIARIDSGNFVTNKTQFDVKALILRVLDSLELKINEKNINVDLALTDEKVITFADEDSIFRVAYNLIENAVKFSQENSSVEINLLTKNKKAYIAIKNYGEGIKREDLPFVFERFYKGDKSRGVDKKGIGLGLYIAKHIINSHEEQLWVKSEEQEYAEFIFTLPIW